MRTSWVAAVVILSLFCSLSFAAEKKKKKKEEEPQGVSREYMRRACQLADEYLAGKQPRLGSDGGWCLGYAMGFIDSQVEGMFIINKNKPVQQALAKDGVLFCLPKEATYQTVIKTVTAYIDRTKASKKETTSSLFKDALMKTYPCKKIKSPKKKKG